MRSNNELIDYLSRSGVLKSPRLIKAFRAIDRVNFVPKKYQTEAYGDYPLSIGRGQTISQPTTVAFMLELLQPRSGEKILDVGSGSGWTTALLARLVGPKGRVIGLEIVPELVEYGANNLKQYDLSWAEIRQAGVELGLPQEAPFSKILVSAAANQMPKSLAEQLTLGGRLVIPIVNSIFKIDKVNQANFTKEEHYGFSFVPLIK